MGRLFDNGATQARARAWGLWAVLAGVLTVWTAAGAGPVWLRAAGAAVGLGFGSAALLVQRRPRKIAALNYHSISACPGWLPAGSRLAVSPSTFERQLRYLQRKGYQTLSVSELAAALRGARPLDPRGRYVALTFDDGYADVWIGAFPLLRQYGMKATVFVSTDFVRDAAACRPTLEHSPAEALDWRGYVTWPELQAMRDSGLVDVQSHGADHGRVFTAARCTGFVAPERSNVWLLWSKFPDGRAGGVPEEAARALWGHPLFPQGPALACRAYQPDPAAVEHMQEWARARGAAGCSGRGAARELRREWRRYRRVHGDRSSRETEAAYAVRVRADLRRARAVLAAELGVQSDVLCWPENAFSPAGESLAREEGYRVTVSNRHGVRNAVGESGQRIVRVFVGERAAGFAHEGLDFAAFVLELKVFEGGYGWYPPLFVIHRVKQAVLALKRWTAGGRRRADACRREGQPSSP